MKGNKNTQPMFRPGIKTFTVKVHGRGQRRDAGRVAIGAVRKAFLKMRYPNAGYEPLGDCQFCGGYGEVKRGRVWKPCVCIYVRHADIQTALKVLQEMAENPDEIRKSIEWAGLENWSGENVQESKP